MKISSLANLQVNNYKNLSLQNGVQLKNLNILIGSNGSGKSNFINLLKFLKTATTISSEQSTGATSFQKAFLELGGINSLDATILPPAIIDTTFDFTIEEGSADQLRLEISMLVPDKAQGLIINKEFLSGIRHKQDKPFYYYKFHDLANGQGVIAVENEQGAPHTRFQKIMDVPANELALLTATQLLESLQNPDLAPFYNVRRQLLATISQWHFYNANNMNLSEIRKASPEIGPTDKFLNPLCDNLPIVFDNLTQGNLAFERKIDTAMRDVFPSTTGIRASRLGRLRLSIDWHLDQIKRPFYLDEMSDGTVRMLCWALILLSPQLPSLLVIDEPEIGLHVQWLRYLAEWIKDAAHRTQVIITTHSPDLLDQFTDHVENVLVFQNQEKDALHTEVRSLSPTKLEPWLKEGWELGDLYRIGDPVIGGWPV